MRDIDYLHTVVLHSINNQKCVLPVGNAVCLHNLSNYLVAIVSLGVARVFLGGACSISGGLKGEY